MQDIHRIISSTLPQQDTGKWRVWLRRFLQATGGGSNTVSPAGGAAPENSPRRGSRTGSTGG